MTTTDSNGIVRYQTTDPVSPLHTLLNLGMQSVSDAITPINGRTFKTVTSTTRPASPAVGLRIWETDTQQERTWNGTSWVWSGGVKPSSYFTCSTPANNLSTNAAAGTGIVMAAPIARGGITAQTSGSYTFAKVKDTGLYRITLTAKLTFTTGVASGGGLIMMSIGKYSSSAVLAESRDVARTYPPGTTNFLDTSFSGTALMELEAGQMVLPLFSRVGGAVDWTVASGTITSMTVEWVSP